MLAVKYCDANVVVLAVVVAVVVEGGEVLEVVEVLAYFLTPPLIPPQLPVSSLASSRDPRVTYRTACKSPVSWVVPQIRVRREQYYLRFPLSLNIH